MLRSAARLSRQFPTSSRTVVSRSISSTLSFKSKVLETSPSVRPSVMTATINGHGSDYTPFLLSPVPGAELRDGVPAVDESDWTSELDLSTATEFSRAALRDRKLKVLVLYGSLRERSYSRLMAYEAARILHHMGCDVRVFDPKGLPVKDDVQHDHPKVQELRGLSLWSDAQFWSSPEQHGNITAVMKNQIDWIPLSTGSVRPTQGRTLAFAQINGGSQSFNTVNTLRILGRWMRMFVIPNQSSLPLAWKSFTPAGRLMPSSNRDRLVDVCEELVKTSAILLPHSDLLNDRFSEREEKRIKGKLLTQAEKEKEKDAEKEKERVALAAAAAAAHEAHAATPSPS
ncbi:hypothetical protein EHS25_010185 [Saitozyma podzolica]|uniref:NADPH-dependent FMN reductase-like domain-containing protein n=1 Tax=Saitozyma podzolica TaxID=1890683 RepID=A0A427YIW4_9TREE|nr:hypothetical protein EHS25_010185 [Saitozyma podzolica]